MPISSSGISTPASSSAGACRSTWTRPGGPSRRAWRAPWRSTWSARPGESTRWSTRTWRRAARMHGIERGKDLRALSALRLRRGRARALPGGWRRILRVPRILVPVRRRGHVGLGLPGGAAGLRLRAHRSPAARRGRLGPDQRALRGDGGRGARSADPAPGWPPRDIRIARIAEMRYVGQGHEVEAAIPAGALGRGQRAAVTRQLRGRVSRPLPSLAAGHGHRGHQLARDRVGAAARRCPPHHDRRDGGSEGAGKGSAPAYFPEAGGFVDDACLRPLRSAPRATSSWVRPSWRSASPRRSSGRARVAASTTAWHLVVEMPI